MKALLAPIVAAAALLATGCESAVSAGGQSERLTQNDWVAEQILGQPVIKKGRVTLSLAEGRVSGRSGCNLYSGAVEVRGASIKVGPLISTKMACMEDGVMQQEQAYLSALEGAQHFSFGADGRLTIATRAGALVYESAPRQARPDE